MFCCTSSDCRHFSCSLARSVAFVAKSSTCCLKFSTFRHVSGFLVSSASFRAVCPHCVQLSKSHNANLTAASTLVGVLNDSLVAIIFVPELPKSPFVRLVLFQDRGLFFLRHGEGWSVRASWSLSNVGPYRVAVVSSAVGKYCSFKSPCRCGDGRVFTERVLRVMSSVVYHGVRGRSSVHGEFPYVSDVYCCLPQ